MKHFSFELDKNFSLSELQDKLREISDFGLFGLERKVVDGKTVVIAHAYVMSSEALEMTMIAFERILGFRPPALSDLIEDELKNRTLH